MPDAMGLRIDMKQKHQWPVSSSHPGGTHVRGRAIQPEKFFEPAGDRARLIASPVR